MSRIRIALIACLLLLGAWHLIDSAPDKASQAVAARYQTRQRTSNFFSRSTISAVRRS